MWGTASDDVWAVSAAGTAVHWNGAAWSPVAASVAGAPAWVCGERRPPPGPSADGTGRSSSSQNGVFTAASYGNTASFNAAWGFGADDVWAVGSNIMHYDGTGWTAVVASTTDGRGRRHGDDRQHRHDERRVGRGVQTTSGPWAPTATRCTGTARRGRTRTSGRGADKDAQAIWGTSSTDIWVVTNCHAGETPDVVHWDGTSWTVTVLDPSVTQNYLYAVWADAPDDVWAVGGGGAIVHYDGAAWSSVVTGNGANATLFSVWGSGPDDVWAAGASGTVVHWNGKTWTQQANAGYDVNNVWGGDDGQMLARLERRGHPPRRRHKLGPVRQRHGHGSRRPVG